MEKLLGAALLGGALGANDAASVFGPAVSSRAVRYRTATLIAAVCVVLGAWLGGEAAIQALAAVGAQTPRSALAVTLAAAAGMILLIALRMPASSSQAVLGAIVGGGLATGSSIDFTIVRRLVEGWVLTPVIACATAAVLYVGLIALTRRLPRQGLAHLDAFVRSALLVAGGWGAYALGANNAANVTGVFAASGMLTSDEAGLLAGGTIMLGMIGFGKHLMFLVGRRLVQLEPPSALVVMLGQALVVHHFALRGIPVSMSQALAGGALGIGLIKGARTIHTWTLLRILVGWIATPLVGGVLAYLLVQVVEPG